MASRSVEVTEWKQPAFGCRGVVQSCVVLYKICGVGV